ncbi:hypothetical protein CRG98_004034 [Punica granatum]|uniref:Endonuclease/exonuclease/phosphatase domain-containing protein n=1 Tax=Punica granatum TaxID=22663 RepID=A0A2I0L4S3_PUNGR|nr:hypothetical protein CRG98_004034 [Punica granatum]
MAQRRTILLLRKSDWRMMGTRVLRWRWMTVEVMCLARRRFLSKEPSNTVTGGRIERAAERSFTGGRPPHGSIHKVAIDVHRPARGPVQTKIVGPWFIIGDFNEIVDPTEKQGGAPFNPTRALRFRAALETCGLMDMGSCGPRFTWQDRQFTGRERVFERLDRAGCNAA